MFYDNVLYLCKENNIKITNLISELGMGSGNLSKWKKGGIPKADTLKKIAEYFNVTVDYVLAEKEYRASNNIENETANLDFVFHTQGDYMSVIDRIIKLLKERGYTQVDLANSLEGYGVTKHTITDWKNGKSKSYYMLIVEISNFFNVTTDYLLTGKEHNTIYDVEKENERMENANIINQELLENAVTKVFNTFCHLKGLHNCDETYICTQFSSRYKMPIKKVKDIKSFKSYPTWEEFNVLITKLDLGDDTECKLLLQELYDHDIFEESDDDKYAKLSSKISELDEKLTEFLESLQVIFEKDGTGK